MKKSQFFLLTTLLASSLTLITACDDSKSPSPSKESEVKTNNHSPNAHVPSETNTTTPVTSDAKVPTSTSNEADTLSSYSSEEINYARVWFQLGTNQQIDELNVQRIAAGTKLNPDDETSLTYPEDVIRLTGSRLIDGVVTYSVKQDGIIDVYHVPLRWDGQYPAGETFYSDIIENKERVPIETGDEDKILTLIQLLNTNE